ncbi:MAG: CsbD family protein [Dokdonella sp.]
MNEDTLKGKWKQAAGKIKAKWGKLTDDDITRAEGNREYLVGKLQESYGMAKDRAEQEIKDFERSL